MPAPDSTLQAIKNKVRRLTQSPSEAQLTNTQLEDYINTFVIYDFPEHLRTFNLRKTFTFFTNPYQDEYPTDELSFGDAVANPTITSNPLYNFQNKYLTVHPPLYVAGYQSFYTQDREQFYGNFPIVNSIQFTGLNGDGVTTTFTGVINSQQAILPNNFQQRIGLLQGEVLFDSLDNNLGGLSLADVPLIDPTTGNKTVFGNLYNTSSAAYKDAQINPPEYPTDLDANNNINYATGAFTITFPNPPGANVPINSQTVPLGLAIPRGILYYANTFVLRPVPDQTYRVNFEVYVRPTELLDSAQKPELEEYWQFIAYGAAKKVLEDKLDMDSVQIIMPEFKKQEALVLRRTLVQYANDRVATIYTENRNGIAGWSGWGNGSNY